MNYSSEEAAERLRRICAPERAQGGCVKAGIRKAVGLLRPLQVSPNRVRNLMRAYAKPTVEEMDLIRKLDGLELRPRPLEMAVSDSFDGPRRRIISKAFGAAVRAALVPFFNRGWKSAYLHGRRAFSKCFEKHLPENVI